MTPHFPLPTFHCPQIPLLEDKLSMSLVLGNTRDMPNVFTSWVWRSWMHSVHPCTLWRDVLCASLNSVLTGHRGWPHGSQIVNKVLTWGKYRYFFNQSLGQKMFKKKKDLVSRGKGNEQSEIVWMVIESRPILRHKILSNSITIAKTLLYSLYTMIAKM